MQKRFRFLFHAVLLALLVVAPGTANLMAQAISGDITGTLQDATGAVVPGANITAQNEATDVSASAKTDSNGGYRFSNLAVGGYTLTATATGFGTSSVKHVSVVLNNIITANMTLQVGSTTTTVEVTESSAPIDTTTGQLQSTFEAKQAVELPVAGLSKTINGAGIWNLSLVSAGVSSSGGVGMGTGPSVGGQRPENNTFFVDGVSNNNHYTTGPLIYVSNEAVAEVSVLQNQFSPEFGGASGGVFNAVVRSGGNQLHGSVYEYLQNRNLNAVDAVVATQGLTSNPRFDNNRLGATIGGPILKDKLFYFGNFEYNPLGQSAVPGAPLKAPTAAGYSALANLSGVSSTNLGAFQKYVGAAPANNAGSINVGGQAIPLGTLSFASPNYDTSYNAIVSVDYNLSDKDQFRGRYIYNKTSGIDFLAELPVFFQPQPSSANLGSFSEFHNFSPTFQNEFRASFSRNNALLGTGNLKFPGLDSFPNITIDQLNSLNVGPDPNAPSGSIQNLLLLADNVSKVVGRHSLKFGYHFTDTILTNYFIQRVRGDYEYSTLKQYLFDLTPDVFGERSAGPSSYPAGFLQNEAYFNDDFRIRPNLTLNLGIRYEYVTMPIASRAQIFSAPANVPGGLTFAEPKFGTNDWSPRIGFAYSPGKDGIWSIRGGVSRAFDLTYANLNSNAAPAYYQTTQDVSLTSNAPNFLAGGGLTGGGGTLPTDPVGALGSVGSYTFGGKRPYAMTWTIGVQRLLGKNYTLEARYVGTKGVHLWNQTRLNIYPQVSAANYIPTFFTMPSAATLAGLTKTLDQVSSFIVPGGTSDFPYNNLASRGSTGNVTSYAPQGNSYYHGLALQMTKRYSNNVSYIAAYTWSHLLDDSTATNFSTYLTPRRAQDFQNMKSEWASSALDHRHRFTFTPIYDWRAFSNRSWMVKNLVSNWTISGTYTYESPEYATVQSGLDSNLNNDGVGDRTIINTAGAARAGTGVTPYNALGQAVSMGDPTTVAYVADSANARYVQAGFGALANSGRNTFALRPTNNIDAALMKRFNIKERMRFDIGCQFFNVLNHAQYTGGFVSDVSPNSFIGSRNDLIPGDPLFGRFDQFYSSNSRQLQLVAHFTF